MNDASTRRPVASRRWRAVSVVGGLVMLAGAATALVVVKRGAVYHYDVRADYHYALPRPGMQPEGLPLSAGTFTPSQPLSQTDTVFLALSVRSSALGCLLAPRVRIDVGPVTRVQSVEHCARGVRYLNLSGMGGGPGQPIRLTGANLSLPDQSVTVLRFGDPGVANAATPILVIAPHPDDAEIAAFGLYSRYPAAVVTVTAGEAGEARMFGAIADPASRFREKGHLRSWNSITVPQLGGVPANRTANLGYFDGTLAAMFAAPSAGARSQRADVAVLDEFRGPADSPLLDTTARRPATWEGLVADMERLLEVIKPGIIVAPHPALDNHPDHQISTLAMVEALRRRGIHSGKLLLYTNHLPYSYMYPYGATGESVTLPPSPVASPYFDALYSVQLSPDDQVRKLLALDAMIDLREKAGGTTFRAAARQLWNQVRLVVTQTDNSYFRRAVRQNEVFFVVDVANLQSEAVVRALHAAP